MFNSDTGPAFSFPFQRQRKYIYGCSSSSGIEVANWHVLNHGKVYGLKVDFHVLMYRSNYMQSYLFCYSNYHLCIESPERALV